LASTFGRSSFEVDQKWSPNLFYRQLHKIAKRYQTYIRQICDKKLNEKINCLVVSPGINSPKKLFVRDKKLKMVTMSGKSPPPPSPDAPPARPPDTSKLDSVFDDMLLDCTVDADSDFIDNWGVADMEHPDNAPRTARGVLSSPPSSLPRLSSGCPLDRWGEDTHTSNSRGNQAGNYFYFYSVAHTLGRCDAQV
jgi:hypothetical protein